MSFTVTITNRSGVKLAEAYDASSKKLTGILNGAQTLSFALRVDEPVTGHLEDGRVLAKAYIDGTLRFCGDLVTGDEQGDGEHDTITYTATSALDRLKYRLVGKSREGLSYTDTPRNELISDLIDLANADGDTGVRAGYLTPMSEVSEGPWRYKKVGEAISELASSYDGFDFRLSPTEPTPDDQGVMIARLFMEPSIGSFRQNVKFDYGDATNTIASYKRGVAYSVRNKVYSLPQGFPDNASQLVLSGEDTLSQARYGVREDIVSSDLVSDELRGQLLTQALAVYGQPKQTLEVTLAETIPWQPFTDFNIGDLVTVNLWRVDRDGQRGLRLGMIARIYSMTIEEGTEGQQQVSLGLVESAA